MTSHWNIQADFRLVGDSFYSYSALTSEISVIGGS